MTTDARADAGRDRQGHLRGAPPGPLAGDGSLPGRWAWSSPPALGCPRPLTAPRAAPARPASHPSSGPPPPKGWRVDRRNAKVETLIQMDMDTEFTA